MLNRLFAYAVFGLQIVLLAFILQHQISIYESIQRIGLHTYATMDAQVRVMHYLKPHTGKILGCRECYSEVHDYLNRLEREHPEWIQRM